MPQIWQQKIRRMYGHVLQHTVFGTPRSHRSKGYNAIDSRLQNKNPKHNNNAQKLGHELKNKISCCSRAVVIVQAIMSEGVHIAEKQAHDHEQAYRNEKEEKCCSEDWRYVAEWSILEMLKWIDGYKDIVRGCKSLAIDWHLWLVFIPRLSISLGGDRSLLAAGGAEARLRVAGAV